jgi:hypothetical protein
MDLGLLKFSTFQVHSPGRECDSADSIGPFMGDNHHNTLQVVFRLAADAVRWCIAVQMQLMLHDWSTSTTGKCAEDIGLVTVPESQADCPLPVAMRKLAEKKCPQVSRSDLCLIFARSSNPFLR